MAGSSNGAGVPETGVSARVFQLSNRGSRLCMLKSITSRHPYIYALLYLALVPVYALLYNEMNRSFFHPTAKYENSLHYDKQRLVMLFERDFKRYHGELLGRDLITQHASILMIGRFEAIDFWVDADFGYFLCSITLVDPRQGLVRGKTVTATQHDLLIKVYLLWGMEKTDVRDDTHTPYVVKMGEFLDTNGQPSGKIGDFDLKDISGVWLNPQKEDPPTRNQKLYLKHFDVNESGKFNVATRIGNSAATSLRNNVVISKQLDAEIMNYFSAISGFPLYFSQDKWSNFPRMLYLSAITVTTVGYGDIVPVTDGARIAVASEAILGIVVIGLFLNGLTARRKSTQ
jgi:hypothetical protein